MDSYRPGKMSFLSFRVFLSFCLSFFLRRLKKGKLKTHLDDMDAKRVDPTRAHVQGINTQAQAPHFSAAPAEDLRFFFLEFFLVFFQRRFFLKTKLLLHYLCY